MESTCAQQKKLKHRQRQTMDSQMSGERKSSSPISTSLPMYCPGNNGCKKSGETGNAEEDFFFLWILEYYLIFLARQNCGNTFLVGQVFNFFPISVEIFQMLKCHLKFLKPWLLDFEEKRRHGNQLKVGSEALLPFRVYQVERLIFFVSKTKSTRSLDEWRGWWIDRS